ncbi:EAL domain-containing protein [Ilumatobacter sp.]|uniref:EAL domain-containing protein n=1 Tax=Ilumatobacter sp. TaxID=1967498 RepID=UPI003B519BF9
MREHPIDPARVTIEVTEQALEDAIVPASVLDDISQLGVQLVLDDFGTGVSSLTHLRTAQLSGIKFDRSFITDTPRGDVDRRVVAGVIDLARAIGISTSAEGVETDEQAAWLTDSGCSRQQGFLYGKPMPPADLIAAARTTTDRSSNMCQHQ